MKFEFKRIGLIDEANIDLADLTILCGENNTGKTYVTYAIYGFLRSWRQLLSSEIEEDVHKILKNSTNQIDISEIFSGKINKYFERLSKQYVSHLPRIFSSRAELFAKSVIKVSITSEISFKESPYHRAIKGTGEKIIATIRKEPNSPMLEILISDQASMKEQFKRYGITDFIIDAIADIVFAPYFGDVFIASTERTGAAIFYRELDFARTRLVEALGQHGQQDKKNDSILRNPFRLFEAMRDNSYPVPVRDNVDFVRRIEDVDKTTSPLATQHPEILTSFEEVIGGSYKIIRGKGLYYQPKGAQKPRLSMSESSSAVRALLNMGFYLRCRAKSGDILMIDEPELNLHPINQRAFARLASQLVNCGIRVFMTTHSDYIIKELNTLIMLNMLNAKSKNIKLFLKRHGYKDEEKLDHTKVKLFITCKQKERGAKGRPAKLNSLKEAKIYPDRGIEVDTFDTTIEKMNLVQEEILSGTTA